jgi:hypothetical protein
VVGTADAPFLAVKQLKNPLSVALKRLPKKGLLTVTQVALLVSKIHFNFQLCYDMPAGEKDLEQPPC